jgi:hypothetical protein
MRKAHIHRFAPITSLVAPGRCTFEGCTAFINDGQFTGLGQILEHGKWVDYARDTEPEAIRWAQIKPEARRVVDWISREELT